MEDPAGGDKAALRSRLLAVRAGLPSAVRDEASALIREQLEQLPELARARALLGYAAFGAEVDLDPYLARRSKEGVGVFLPWVDGEDLAIARVRDLAADLAPGWRGVREPRSSGRRPARVDRLDAAIVPGVGFDRGGHRLGYGGGHFDRLLARLRPAAVAVGVAFDTQLVEEIPTEPWDRAVDFVVTESGLLRCRR